VHIVDTIDVAVRERVPVIGLWHSGGARLAEGVEALHAVGLVFQAMIRASGRVPQISVVLGPAAGGAAYGPALTDVVIMSTDGRVFVTGPDVVRSVTGEQIDMEGLGGPEAHGRKSGVAHVVAGSEAEALASARRVAGLFARPGGFEPRLAGADVDLAELLPEQPQRAYDVHPLVREILDSGENGTTFEELHPKWAPNIVVGLGRLTARWAWSPTTPYARAAASTRSAQRRRHASCGCATHWACPCWSSWTCPATCPGWNRNGAEWSAAGRNCCTPSPRRSCHASP
jgi:acetyl-CoA/propionyl-CoA carboxylase carboxyl transferase subunit